MDPLSITASSIAVLGVITGTKKGIGKLVALRNAPVELQALSNEAEAFRSLLVIVQSSIRHFQGSEAYEECGEALCSLLADAKQAALDLQSTIECELRRGIEVDQNGLPKVSRVTWLRSASRIEDLRAKIRNARDNLSTGLQVINVHISETTRQTAAQLQSISRPASDVFTASGSDFASVETWIPDNEERTNSSAKRTISDEANQVRAGPSLKTQLDMVRHTLPTKSSLVRVTTSVTTQQCVRSCPCQCHTRSYVRSPTWLKAAVGQMLLSYHSLLRTTPCNYPPCRKTARKTEFTYYFPHWVAQKAFILSSKPELSGEGASISVDMPVIISRTHPIWTAVNSGNIPFIQQLFDQGLSPYVIDEDGDSLVLKAAKSNQVETSRFLIEQGAKTDWRNRADISAAAVALTKCQYHGLHSYGLIPEEVAEELNFSDLHTALAIQSLTAKDFEMLLERGFKSVNAVDRLKMTPLHWAAKRGDSTAVELLIRWNANVLATDVEQWTPLHEACTSGGLKCIALLLDAGADANAESNRGRTPLFYIDSGVRGVVPLFLRQGCNLKHKDRHGSTALHCAAERGDSQLIDELIAHGADVNPVDNWGETPLKRGIRADRASAVFSLLQSSKMHGCLIDLAAGSENHNILHFTALFGGVDIMRLLTHGDLSGVNPMSKSRWNITPNEYFVRARDSHCTIIREPFEVEEKAWHELLASVCRQNNIDFNSLGIIPSSRIEDFTTNGDSSSENSNEDEDEGEDAFVDASEELNVS